MFLVSMVKKFHFFYCYKITLIYSESLSIFMSGLIEKETVSNKTANFCLILLYFSFSCCVCPKEKISINTTFKVNVKIFFNIKKSRIIN